MKNIATLLIFSILLAVPAFAVEEIQPPDNKVKEAHGIKKGDILFLSDCVKLAVQNSPKIKKAQEDLKIIQNDVNLAKSNYFPTIGAGAKFFQEFNSDYTYDSGSAHTYLPTVGIYLNQLIWDFGKTNSLISMQKFNKLAAEYNYIESVCETINHIKLHYFAVLKAKSIIEAERDNYNINKRILEDSKNQATYLELQLARQNYNNARISYANVIYDYNSSLAKLQQAMHYNIDEIYFFAEQANPSSGIKIDKSILEND